MTSIKSFMEFLTEAIDMPENISHWQKKPNSQYGSNPGGVFTHPESGEKHYVKFYSNPEQARSEVAASKIYGHLGIPTLSPRLVTHSGRLGVASKWVHGLHRIPGEELDNLSSQDKKALAVHFHAAALVKNHDHIGLDREHVMKDEAGTIHAVDQGGSFRFRAMGGHKDFDHDVHAEHEGLLVPHRPAGSVFSQLSHEDRKAGAQMLHNLTDAHIDKAVEGMQDAKVLANNLKIRKNHLLNKYR